MRGQAHRKDLAKQDIFKISIAPQFFIFKFEMHECSSARPQVCNALKVVSCHITYVKKRVSYLAGDFNIITEIRIKKSHLRDASL